MRILLIEDDKDLCEFLALELKGEGYALDLCHDGGDALFYIEKQVYSLIVLDRMLPGMDGLAILHRMREKKITAPVIMVTAMSAVVDRIAGLDAGADDYLVKPFAPEELLARIRALVRRPAVMDMEETISFEDIQLSLMRRTLTCGNKTIELSRKEMDLMEIFIQNKKQILTREILLNRVWGPDSFVEEGNLDNYIYFLRRRLKNAGSRVTIKTIRSVGYCIQE